jgi:regulator of protease activity HflC (stomatin/prohibitin superfamily)
MKNSELKKLSRSDNAMPPRAMRVAVVAVGMTLFVVGGCATIRPGETALMWRPISSGLSEKPMETGFHSLAPWNSVVRYNVQLQDHRERVVVLTQDDLKIGVTAAVIIRPNPKQIYRLEQEIGRKYYEKVVQPKFRTSIRNVLATYQMVQISKSSRKIEAELKKALAARLRGCHIDVHDVIIDDIQFSQPVLRAIEQKLAKEQEQQRMRFEINIARQRAEIAQIQAKADADAQKTRAKGQASAQRIISESLTQRFLQYKALDAKAAKYFFMPTGKGGLPIVIDANEGSQPQKKR